MSNLILPKSAVPRKKPRQIFVDSDCYRYSDVLRLLQSIEKAEGSLLSVVRQFANSIEGYCWVVTYSCDEEIVMEYRT